MGVLRIILESGLLIFNLLKLGPHAEILRIMNYILIIKTSNYSSLSNDLQRWFAALTARETDMHM